MIIVIVVVKATGRYSLTEWVVGGAGLVYCNRHLHQRNQIWINCNIYQKSQSSSSKSKPIHIQLSLSVMSRFGSVKIPKLTLQHVGRI